jgi:hypothetical protein
MNSFGLRITENSCEINYDIFSTFYQNYIFVFNKLFSIKEAYEFFTENPSVTLCLLNEIFRIELIQEDTFNIIIRIQGFLVSDQSDQSTIFYPNYIKRIKEKIAKSSVKTQFRSGISKEDFLQKDFETYLFSKRLTNHIFYLNK